MFNPPTGNPAPAIISATFDRAPGSYDTATVTGLPLTLDAVLAGGSTGIEIWSGYNNSNWVIARYNNTMPAFPLAVNTFPAANNSLDVIVYSLKYGRRHPVGQAYTWNVTP